MKTRLLIIIGIILLSGMFLINPAFASFTDSILIQVSGDFKKVYYNENEVNYVSFDPYLNSVLFETKGNGMLEIKVPKIYQEGPGIFILKDGVEIAPVTETSDDCFYYFNIESKVRETIEVAFAGWPETKKVNGCETFTVSPLKQFKSGVPVDEIKCSDNLILIQKYDGSPACVTESTKEKLVERGWTKHKDGIAVQLSFCGADGFDSDGNPNKGNSTHIWDWNYCKWQPIGDFESKPNIFLDVASIEENRIALNPTDTCAHISLRLLSADKLEQYHSRDKEVRFFEITETDLEELPVLDELIRATHHLDFTTNDDARTEMGLRELVDYEFFIMGKAIDKYDDSQDDYFVKLDGNLDEKLADPKPQGFSNEFLSPQLVYGDNAYVLSHTVFWVANEHEMQSLSVHLQDSIDNDKKFITLTDEDMESIPKIKQAIDKIGTEFESIHARKGLPENPDWNEYREWFGQKKAEQFNLDETYVPGFVYDNEYYDLGFPIC